MWRRLALKIKWHGDKELRQKLIKNAELSLAKQIVKTNGAEMQQKMVKNAVFTKGYSTGATRRSITGERADNDLTYKAGPHTEYSPYVEYGTRKMAAQPFVRPAFNSQKEKFKEDMDRLVR